MDFSCDREIDTSQSESIVNLNRSIDELTEELGELLREKFVNGETGFFPKSKLRKISEIENELDRLEGVINFEYSLFKSLDEDEQN